MNNSNSIQNFWQNFCTENPEINMDEPYEVWHFANNPETAKKLVHLVLSGKKKATASLMEHESDNGDGGIIGGYSIVTDFDKNPQCVIVTTEVRHLPFREVDAEFAFDEGEGDQTLEYWRKAHRKFFTECCLELGLKFDESMLICCKRFRKLFPTLASPIRRRHQTN
ncbi:MAG: ASCH domain-containing protein [Acidobacteria bacterium]|nr:ASCH domain-containing protein [Acidobacteriota bacterium]MCA1639419.1 ASCH domain-containing protein [Acidobacteriota bacterium]